MSSGSGGEPEDKILKTEARHVLSFDDTSGSEAITLTSAKEAQVLIGPDGSIILTDKAGSKVTLDAAASEIRVEDANGNSIVRSSTGIPCTDTNGSNITASGAGVEIGSSAVVNIEGSMVTIAGSGGEPMIKGTTFLSLFHTHTHGSAIGPTTPQMVPLTGVVAELPREA